MSPTSLSPCIRHEGSRLDVDRSIRKGVCLISNSMLLSLGSPLRTLPRGTRAASRCPKAPKLSCASPTIGKGRSDRHVPRACGRVSMVKETRARHFISRSQREPFGLLQKRSPPKERSGKPCGEPFFVLDILEASVRLKNHFDKASSSTGRFDDPSGRHRVGFACSHLRPSSIAFDTHPLRGNYHLSAPTLTPRALIRTASKTPKTRKKPRQNRGYFQPPGG